MNAAARAMHIDGFPILFFENDADRLKANPLGIYVNAVNWSREMSQ